MPPAWSICLFFRFRLLSCSGLCKLFCSWKIKYNIFIKRKGKRSHVTPARVTVRGQRSDFISEEVNTEMKSELPGIHAFQDGKRLLGKKTFMNYL